MLLWGAVLRHGQAGKGPVCCAKVISSQFQPLCRQVGLSGLHFRRLVLTVVQKTNLRGAGPEVGVPRRRLPQKPTEMTGTLSRTNPRKGEERAQRYFG